MGATTISPRPVRRGPRAPTRRGFRHPLELPLQPAGVEVLAAIAHTRATNPPDFGDPKVVNPHTRQHEWDATLETSVLAVFFYLWRRGRGEKWAGRGGSARYACSISQLTLGLAPIMGWKNIPDRRDEAAVRRFVRAHRRSVQRWLDWLQAADLVQHQPCKDTQGFWWRTLITLRPCPQLSKDRLQAAVDRREGWFNREARRAARGRRRDLTTILRSANPSRSELRHRGIVRRRELAAIAERHRVRRLVQEGLNTRLAHPLGAEATPQNTFSAGFSHKTDRRHARNEHHQPPVDETVSNPATAAIEQRRTRRGGHPDAGGDRTADDSTKSTLYEGGQNTTPNPELGGRQRPELDWGGSEHTTAGEIRAAVYREIATKRWYRDQQPLNPLHALELMASAEVAWAGPVRRQLGRIEELSTWPTHQPAPERWRLLEAWANAAHGPELTAAGGFRLAFYSEARHGARLDRALRRYARHAAIAAPAGWPVAPIAGLMRWIREEVRQQDGPDHGFAVDIQRFDAFTKDMAAYGHYREPGHLQRAARRAHKRQELTSLAATINGRFSFRTDKSTAAKLQTARELLDSDYEPHRRDIAALYAQLKEQHRLEQRDQALITRQHPGTDDGRFMRACHHASRWKLPTPTATWDQ